MVVANRKIRNIQIFRSHNKQKTKGNMKAEAKETKSNVDRLYYSLGNSIPKKKRNE